MALISTPNTTTAMAMTTTNSTSVNAFLGQNDNRCIATPSASHHDPTHRQAQPGKLANDLSRPRSPPSSPHWRFADHFYSSAQAHPKGNRTASTIRTYLGARL